MAVPIFIPVVVSVARLTALKVWLAVQVLACPKFKETTGLVAPVATVMVLSELEVVWSPVLAPDIDEVPVTAKVGVELPERVILLTVVGVMAPRVKAKAPAVLLAETPLPVVTELTRVPEVGSVTLVVPVWVRVKAKFPLVVTLLPKVIVLEPLLTPVPP